MRKSIQVDLQDILLPVENYDNFLLSPLSVWWVIRLCRRTFGLSMDLWGLVHLHPLLRMIHGPLDLWMNRKVFPSCFPWVKSVKEENSLGKVRSWEEPRREDRTVSIGNTAWRSPHCRKEESLCYTERTARRVGHDVRVMQPWLGNYSLLGARSFPPPIALVEKRWEVESGINSIDYSFNRVCEDKEMILIVDRGWNNWGKLMLIFRCLFSLYLGLQKGSGGNVNNW